MKKKHEVEVSESGFLTLKDKKGDKEKEKAETEEKNISDKILLISIAVMILVIIFFLSFRFFTQETPKTLDDLHALNLQGKLEPDQGYIYNRYSFVYFDGLWYTQVQKGNNLFSIPLHYAPKDLEDIPLTGSLNSSLFNKNKFIYYTFNPISSELKYVSLAIWEFTNTLTSAMNKFPKPACDRNETAACKKVPILTCDNKVLPIAYFREENETLVSYNDNCIIVQGEGQDIVRATDRMLLNLYGIME